MNTADQLISQKSLILLTADQSTAQQITNINNLCDKLICDGMWWQMSNFWDLQLICGVIYGVLAVDQSQVSTRCQLIFQIIADLRHDI